MRARNRSPAAPCRGDATVCLSCFSWDRSSYFPAKPSQDDVLPWLYLSLRQRWETCISFNQCESQRLTLQYVWTLWNLFNYTLLICRDRKRVTLEYTRDAAMRRGLQPSAAPRFPEYLLENLWEKSHRPSRQLPVRLMMMMAGVCNNHNDSLSKFRITKQMW